MTHIWRESYKAAILETDWTTMQERLRRQRSVKSTARNPLVESFHCILNGDRSVPSLAFLNSQSRFRLRRTVMASIYLSGVFLIILGVALPRPAEAQLGKIGPIGPAAGPIIGAIVGTAAAVVVATVVVIHYSKKRTITGCVVSVPN